LTGFGFGAAFGIALGAAFRAAFLRTPLAGLTERRTAGDRFALARAARAGLRVEELRAFTARRNFAMPGA
jgi:hypothetical protein